MNIFCPHCNELNTGTLRQIFCSKCAKPLDSSLSTIREGSRSFYFQIEWFGSFGYPAITTKVRKEIDKFLDELVKKYPNHINKVSKVSSSKGYS